MKDDIKFRDLRQLLLELGFRETDFPSEFAFHHQPSDTLFVFRPHRPADPVADYNLMEVKDILDARGLMPADSFERRFQKLPA